MRTPLCHICIKSGILCPRCQELVDSGEYDELDIDVMKTLLELEEEAFQELKDMNYHKSYLVENLLVIQLSGKSLSPYRLTKIARQVAEKLKDKYNVKVRIIEKTGELRKMASQLLSPARILGVNTLWFPDGSFESIIRVSKLDERLLPARKEVIEEILSKILNATVKVRFE